MSIHKVEFVKEKETKNTVKFAEVQVEGKPIVVGTLYIQKWAAGQDILVKATFELGTTPVSPK